MKSKTLVYAVILVFLSLIHISSEAKTNMRTKVKHYDPSNEIFKDYSHIAEGLVSDNRNNK